MKKLFPTFALCLCSYSASATSLFEVPRENLFVPSNLGSSVRVTFCDGEFSSKIEGKSRLINVNISGLPNNLKQEQLESFLKYGYLSLNKLDNGEIAILAQIRGLGGSDKVAAAKQIVDTALKAGGHRDTDEWIGQGNHRTPSQWLAQDNHRSVGEWLSGEPSRNSANSKANSGNTGPNNDSNGQCSMQ
jgi:hypothetical protein